jgi:hypothetical protein
MSENEPWWAELWREQRAAGFRDLEGADGWVRLPVSDRLLADVLKRLPGSTLLSGVELIAEADNRFVVRVRVARLPMPPLRLELEIARQPVLPALPVLVLRMRSRGVAVLAAAVSRFGAALPPEVRLDGDLIRVDVAALLTRFGAADALDYLSHLEVTTEPGRVVIAARASVPPGSG